MVRRLTINPILKKDILVNSRNRKMITAITLINCLFAVITFMLYVTSGGSMFQTYYSNIAAMFPVLASCEIGIICLVMPILTSTSVSGERERQTLEIMLTTPIKPMSIVYGKLVSAMVTTLMYVIATLPFMAASFVVGGLSWTELLKYLGMVIFLDIYIGSIGVFFSCVKRTSVSAAVSSIVTVVAVVLITYAAGHMCESMMYSSYDTKPDYALYMGIKATCYTLNPAIWIAASMLSLAGLPYTLSAMKGYGAYSDFLIDYMAVISVCVNLIAAFILMRIGSYKLFYGKAKKKREKNKYT